MADFSAEEREIKIGGKIITVVNLTPDLSENEKRIRKNGIEQTLYGVFRKYCGTGIERGDLP